MSAAQAVGALGSALLFSRGYAIRPMAWGVCIGWILTGGAAIGFGLTSVVGLALGFALLLGIAGPLSYISSQTIWMSYTPNTERGRIFAARRTIAWGIQPISVALGGLLAEQVGVSSLYVGAGILIILIALGNLAFNRPIRSLYSPDLDPSRPPGLFYRL